MALAAESAVSSLKEGRRRRPLSNCKGLLVGAFAPQGPDPANEGGD
jgi:hypothetical protein